VVQVNTHIDIIPFIIIYVSYKYLSNDMHPNNSRDLYSIKKLQSHFNVVSRTILLPPRDPD